MRTIHGFVCIKNPKTNKYIHITPTMHSQATSLHTKQGCVPSPSVQLSTKQPHISPQVHSSTPQNQTARHRHTSHKCSASQHTHHSIRSTRSCPHRHARSASRTHPLWRASLVTTLALVATVGMLGRGGLLVAHSASPAATPADTPPPTRSLPLDTFRYVFGMMIGLYECSTVAPWMWHILYYLGVHHQNLPAPT